MSEKIVKTLINTNKYLNDKEYLIFNILYSAAPTIAMKKPSSLINFNKSNRNLYSLWNIYKKELEKELSVDFYELKKTEDTIIVLFYNKKFLKKVLLEEKNIRFLKEIGYDSKMSMNRALYILKKHYENKCPHEIGIFLGYPIEDVVDFFSKSNKECLMIGYWKVYNNIDKAKSIFSCYDKVKYKVINMICDGMDMITVMKSISIVA